MKKAVLVARVSRSDKDQDPESQLHALREAARRHGFTVVGELPFFLSAWEEDQAAIVWREVMNKLDETAADVLMCWALDRLTRGGIEQAFRRLRDLDHRGVTFYSLREPFLTTVQPEAREMLVALLAWVARWESQHRSERLKAKARLKVSQAERLGQRAIWGPGSIPTPADVSRMRVLRRRGLGYREIAKQVGFSVATVHKNIAGPGGMEAPPFSSSPHRREDPPQGD